MPLFIGIVNGLELGYTEEELDFINGFYFGVLMMQVGMGKVTDPVKFMHRLEVTAKVFEGDLPDWFDLPFVMRMQEDGWSANIGEKTTRRWKADMKRILFNRIEQSVL